MSRRRAASDTGPAPQSLIDPRIDLGTYEDPSWKEEDSSLDPIDDLSEFLEHQLRIPPAVYDGLQAAIAEEVAALEAAKSLQLSPAERAAIEKRQQLVEGRPLEEVRWLKLKAYHRALDKLRARQDEAAAARTSPEYLAAHGAPLDVVPAADILQTPAAFAAAQQGAPAQHSVGFLARIGRSRPSPSGIARSGDAEDSEWAYEADSYAQHTYVFDSLADGFECLRVPRAAAAAAEDGFKDASGSGRDAADGATGQRTIYTADYLKRKELAEQVARQQRRSAQAFWLPLLGALSASGLRWLWRRRQQRAKEAAAAAAAAAAAVPGRKQRAK